MGATGKSSVRRYRPCPFTQNVKTQKRCLHYGAAVYLRPLANEYYIYIVQTGADPGGGGNTGPIPPPPPPPPPLLLSSVRSTYLLRSFGYSRVLT